MERTLSEEDRERPKDSQKGFLHKFRFMNWSPSGVLRLAAVPDGGLVVIGRDSGALEFWETRHSTCLKRVAGRSDRKLTGLDWIAHEDGLHLVGTTLEGTLIEWSLETGEVMMEEVVDGGGVWSMALCSNGDRIAVACEDGIVRVFRPQFGSGFELYGLLPCESTRALCVDWSPREKQLAVGYADGSVRLFVLLDAPRTNLHLGRWQTVGFPNRQSVGHETQRLTVSSRSSPAIWSVLHLGAEVVVGDADGEVSWWDTRHGSRLCSFRKHEGEVTCLRHCIQHDIEYVLSSGAEGGVVIYRRQSSGWSCLHLRRPHVHDIHSLVVFESEDTTRMMTASADGLVLSVACPKTEDIIRAFLRKRLRLVDPLPERPTFQLNGRLLMGVMGEAIEIYRIPPDPSVDNPSAVRQQDSFVVLGGDRKEESW